ncbi:MAG TPA: competence/damage-inducible protein A [Ktedonobacterales bacterium]|nr:competence/damage-inducible protein A [Ktedonobacterales bacterium]
MRAEILSIGTELLLGQITDTNAAYLAQQLPLLGIDLYFVSQVGDNLERLSETLRRARDRSDLVVMTGGLGPTEDDLSREAIAAVLGETPHVDVKLEATLRAFFAGRNIPMPERNVKQAWVIPSATPLANPVGTAPGWWAERDGKIVVAMPGVPHEMKRMWEHEVIPRLRSKTGTVLFTRILRVAGMGESTVEERLGDLIHTSNPTVATYAKQDGVDVRISAKAETEDAAKALVVGVETRARDALGSHVFGIDRETPQSVVLRLLVERGLTLATMESCTGGLLASLVTDVPGSSEAFLGGLVSYATDLKVRWGVPAETVEKFGVISVETARAMAASARERLGASLGVGITGVAGPDEVEGKQAGTVHIAVATSGSISDTSQLFRGGRAEVKWRAAITALNLLRLHLLREGSSAATT